MIRTLIVDDEQPARERLRLMLNSMDGLEVIGEAFTTGSSIMPQKKNPDVAELVKNIMMEATAVAAWPAGRQGRPGAPSR